MNTTAVIGGGAAGMAAAIAAARHGDRVLLFERLDRVGKKLLATGNGRCNLMNCSAPAYPGGSDFAVTVLSRCDTAALEQFFHSLGLQLRTEDMGRVYPVSGQAASVLDAFRLALHQADVELHTACPVHALHLHKGGFLLSTTDGSIFAHRVIVTGGGKAQPKLGSDGSCFALLTELGHHLVRPFPALTQIETDTQPIRGLSGIRIRTEAWITQGSQTLHRTEGEALFADYGLSGVCIMQLARYAQGRSVQLHLNFIRAMGFNSPAALQQELLRRKQLWQDVPMEQLLTGLCVNRLGVALLRCAGITLLSRPVASLKSAEIDALASLAADFALPVTGVKGFDSAQVTAGGIETSEFSPDTLCSHLVPGLHAAGEILNVDGDCGGFNLMFAFASGLLAGCEGHLEEVLT